MSECEYVSNCDLAEPCQAFKDLRARVAELMAECTQHVEEISRLQADIIQMRGWNAPANAPGGPTIDDTPSCGSENDWRKARPAQSPAGADLIDGGLVKWVESLPTDPVIGAMRSALERCRIVLGNMAIENEGGYFTPRWQISHEPLRNDARNLLPVIDAVLNAPANAKEVMPNSVAKSGDSESPDAIRSDKTAPRPAQSPAGAKQAWEDWWRDLCLKGDPIRRPFLVNEAFHAGWDARGTPR